MKDIDPLRKIYIVGDIDHDAYLRFTRRMALLESRSDSRIHIVLQSDGGIGMVGLSFYDRIKMSSCPVTITGTGLIASAAVIILSAGKHRSMTSNAWVMVHDDISGLSRNLRIGQAEKSIKDARKIEDHWNALMARNTKTNILNWDTMHRQETYLTPNDCLALGLIDEILEEK